MGGVEGPDLAGVTVFVTPQVGGVELDLPALSEAILTLGGLQQVINKNKWPKVAEMLKVPKAVSVTGVSLYFCDSKEYMECYCKTIQFRIVLI